MNYIELLNRFEELDLEYSFSPLEIAIYTRLLWKCNRLKWKNPFVFGCDEFRAKVRTTNKDGKTAFDTARNRLKQAGLIEYWNGNGRGNYTRYEVKGVEKRVAKSTPFKEREAEKGMPNPPLSDTLFAPFSASLSKVQKINKTKINQTEGRESEVRQIQPVAFAYQSFPLPELQGTCALNGIPEEFTEAWWMHYEANGWLDGSGKRIVQPVVKILGFWKNERQRPKGGINGNTYGNGGHAGKSNSNGIPAAADKYAGVQRNGVAY